MIQRGWMANQVVGALAGAALLLVSGCAGSPSATSGRGASGAPGPSVTPHGSTPASTAPQGTSGPAWTATVNMMGVRYRQTATLLADGKVLVAGGFIDDASHPLFSAELYDPGSGSWTATGNMQNARQGHSATLLRDGKVLVAGGSDSTATAELYDPTSGSWTVSGSMVSRAADSPAAPGARLYHTATLLPDGKVIVTGGSSFSLAPTLHAVATVELYDPGSGAWAATGTMSEPRVYQAASLLPDGKVLVAGGSDSNGPLASAEVYDVKSGSWTATGMMGAGRTASTATLLPGGKVLVAGGSLLASNELYDAAVGSWSASGSMHLGRQGQTATLLEDGKVLVAGGAFAPLGSAELYDPGSGAWTATANMVTARVNHTATLLADGNVLVAGGDSLKGRLASAELYDPGSGT